MRLSGKLRYPRCGRTHSTNTVRFSLLGEGCEVGGGAYFTFMTRSRHCGKQGWKYLTWPTAGDGVDPITNMTVFSILLPTLKCPLIVPHVTQYLTHRVFLSHQEHLTPYFPYSIFFTPSHPHLTVPTLAPLTFLTANGLSSAALTGSRLNNVVRYKPKNRTIVCGRPLPCENCAGLLSIAPISGITGALTDLLALPPPAADSEPSVCPLPENPALAFAGPLAASAAAERTAVRRAVALAPRTVSFTALPLRMRKVGILHKENTHLVSNRACVLLSQPSCM